MPKNWKRNWPVKRVSPTAPRSGQEMDGRARNRAGSDAMRKRRAASSGGEKEASPILVAMKATPQMTTTRTARKTSAGVTLEGARADRLLPVAAREGRDHAEPDVHAPGDPALAPHALRIAAQPVRRRSRPHRIEPVRDHAQRDEEQAEAQDLRADIAACRRPRQCHSDHVADPARAGG